MELEDLKELMDLLKDTDISELQVEKDGIKIKIKREKLYSHLEIQRPMHLLHEKKEIKEGKEIKTEGKLLTITSPIVGTFYRSSSPDAEHFVDVGARIKKGQILCTIEAMKLVNEIESEVDGVIVKILIENGHPVEYGQPIFLIEPVEEQVK